MITDLRIGFRDPSAPQQSASAVDWIAAYLEWMEMEWTDRCGSPEAARKDSSELFVSAYFEWMDAEVSPQESRPRCHTTTSADTRRNEDDGVREPDASMGVDAMHIPLLAAV